MNRKNVYALLAGVVTAVWVLFLPVFLFLYGYADVSAGMLAFAMVASGIWLSAKGMAQLKQHEADALTDNALETAYRYRNAGIALGLTGSGLLVFSWQNFLGRFIVGVSAGT